MTDPHHPPVPPDPWRPSLITHPAPSLTKHLTTSHVWSTEMNLMAEQLARAQCAERLADAERQRQVARLVRARRAERRAQRASARAARANRRAAAARLALG